MALSKFTTVLACLLIIYILGNATAVRYVYPVVVIRSPTPKEVSIIKASKNMFDVPNICSKLKYYVINADIIYAEMRASKMGSWMIISKQALITLSLEELSAIIAHELAHCEYYFNNNGGIESNHWETDFRAVEMTNKDYLLSVLNKVYKEGDIDTRNKINKLNNIFFVKYFLVSDLNKSLADLQQRIDRLEDLE